MQSRSSRPFILANQATLLLSIPVLVVGIWLAARHGADCLIFLALPLIVIGVVMMVVSLVGLWGAHTGREFLQWAYICLIIMVLLALLAFTIFTFVVTKGSSGHKVEGASFKEYKLWDYSYWMRTRMSNSHNWNKIKRCLLKDQACQSMDYKYPSQSIMYHSKLSYVESGCCKPPSACSFTYVNATTWVNPITEGADADCLRWANDPLQLCYNCDSCKAAVICTVNKDWRKAAKVLLTIFIVVKVIFILACIAVCAIIAQKDAYI